MIYDIFPVTYDAGNGEELGQNPEPKILDPEINMINDYNHFYVKQKWSVICISSPQALNPVISLNIRERNCAILHTADCKL